MLVPGVPGAQFFSVLAQRGCVISVSEFQSGSTPDSAKVAVLSDRAGTRRSKAFAYLPFLAFGLDLVLISTALTIAVAAAPEVVTTPVVGSLTLSVALLASAGVWVLFTVLLRGYSPQILGAGPDEFRVVLHSSLLTAAAAGIGCYLTRSPLPRDLYLLAFLTGVPLLLGGRLVLRRVVHRARANGALRLRVLAVGTPAHVDEIASVLRRESWLGYDVVGALVPHPQPGPDAQTMSGVPVLGLTSEVAATAAAVEADVVLLAGGAVDSAQQMRRIAWDLEYADIQVVVAPSVTDVSRERIQVRPVGGLPLIHLEKPRTLEASRSAKRLFDIVGSATLLLLLAPLFAIAALRIRLHDGGPVLFRQIRVGRDGTPFHCLKLRTMVVDAEQLLAQIPRQRTEESVLFKMTDDPRITAPGRWMRRFSVDELPQLVNVLRGEMSLVGPRPPLRHEVAQYDADMVRRLRVRPGMTGLWQVSGRSDLSWSETVRLDLYYVDNWSMVQDLAILARTFGAVFGSRGAY